MKALFFFAPFGNMSESNLVLNIHCNHRKASVKVNAVNIWNEIILFKKNQYFEGHIESSLYFWGDLCRKYITYVRNFIFSDINTLKYCPYMPYKDPTKPFVNYWFASSDGNNVKKFNKCISDKNQDRLEEEGGACIMYTHFADRFCSHGKLSEKFKIQMTSCVPTN